MRPGAHNIRISFTGAALTHFGGIYLVHMFLRTIGFRSFLHETIRFDQRKHRYTLSEMLLALMYPMILGLEKIEVSALLKTNGVFGYITGLPSFPDPQTFRRFLVRAAPELLPQLRSAHDWLRTHFLCLPTAPGSFWIDCDSTACTLYGKQEGVVKGYNPNRHGKKSYHPLIVTEGHRGDCLAGMLRSGNAHTAEGADALIERARVLLPHQHDLRLRADSGFYDGKLVAGVRDEMGFAVVAKMTAPVKAAVQEQTYRRMSKKFSTSSFLYQPHGWKEEERFVVLRRLIPPEEQEEQTLFAVDAYAYSVICTNLPLTPYGTFQFYGDRMGMERIIRMLKDDYPFGSAPTGDFEANALYAELSMLAYNLIIWFKRLCLPDDWQSFTLPTIRHRLLMIPGAFVKTQNVPTLRMPRNSLYQNVFSDALEKIRLLDPLI
jgi:hypothetical protein